jgi:hypothetical protein
MVYVDVCWARLEFASSFMRYYFENLKIDMNGEFRWHCYKEKVRLIGATMGCYGCNFDTNNFTIGKTC